MKSKFCYRKGVSLFMPLLLIPLAAHAQPTITPLDDPTAPPPEPTEDALLLLARSANINIIADASDFREAANTKTLGMTAGLLQGTLAQRLGYLRAAHHVTQFQMDDKTFLFWMPPDVNALAVRLANGEMISLVKSPYEEDAKTTPQRSSITNENLTAALGKYWQNLKDKNDDLKPSPDGTLLRLPLIQAPDELRQAIIAHAQGQLLQNGLAGGWAAWFNDDFWKSAHLQLRVLDNKPPQLPPALAEKFKDQLAKQAPLPLPLPPPQQVLFLSGKYTDPAGRRGTVMLSIGVRDLPEGSKTPPLNAPPESPTAKP